MRVFGSSLPRARGILSSRLLDKETTTWGSWVFTCFGPCATPPASSVGRIFYIMLHTCGRFYTELKHERYLSPVVCSKSNRKCFQVHIPLPLPKHLIVFGLGDWKSSETTISVDVVVSAELPAQNIGTLSPQARYAGEKYHLFCAKQINENPNSILSW